MSLVTKLHVFHPQFFQVVVMLLKSSLRTRLESIRLTSVSRMTLIVATIVFIALFNHIVEQSISNGVHPYYFLFHLVNYLAYQ